MDNFEQSNEPSNPQLNSNPKPDLPAGSRAAIGLAVASFVLGIVSLTLSLFAIATGFGIAGLILGIVRLRKKQPFFRALAIWGVVLSALGSIIGIALGTYYGIQVYRTWKIVKSAGQAQPLSAYIGTVSPDMTLTDLDGNKIVLSQLKGKQVVLDFWATWCPPCKKEIPHFIKLADKKDSNLVIIGINSSQEKDLKDWVTKAGINYPIVSESNLPAPYNEIASIPTTVFIDSNGIIKNVLVGYHNYNNLEVAALAGDYKGQTKQSCQQALALEESPIKNSTNLEWSLNMPGAMSICTGKWGTDDKQKILVADRAKTLRVIDLQGKILQEIKLPEIFAQMEIGRHKQFGCRLLGYSNWGKQVTVVDCNGSELWAYPTKMGVDGAHWGDLDGDGTDEMVIGFNGSGGLHAISADGELKWEDSEIGNVWNQAVATTRNPQHTRIFATEAGGNIMVYDVNGKNVNTLRPMEKYYSQMAASCIDSNDKIQVLAIGFDGTVVALDSEGRMAWTARANHGTWRVTNFGCADINSDGLKEWAFIEANGDLVIASNDGKKLASLGNQKDIVDFAICSDPNGGALLTLGKDKLNCYSIRQPAINKAGI